MKSGDEGFWNVDELEGRYANYFKIGHNAVEFLLDFGQSYSENGKFQIHTRIITSPLYARALLETLLESIDRYEKTFGILPRKGSNNKRPMNQTNND